MYDPPSLRCAAGQFSSIEEALQWALTTADERFSDGGLEHLEINRYWLYDDGLEVTGTALFDAAVVGTVP